MKQLAKLTEVCAKRSDILMQVYEGMVSVYVEAGPERTYMLASWNDDKKLGKIIFELEKGRYAKTNKNKLLTNAA